MVFTETKETSLLDQARGIKRASKVQAKDLREELDVALAWLRDELTDVQCAMVLHTSGGSSVRSRLAATLRRACAKGWLEIQASGPTHDLSQLGDLEKTG